MLNKLLTSSTGNVQRAVKRVSGLMFGGRGLEDPLKIMNFKEQV